MNKVSRCILIIAITTFLILSSTLVSADVNNFGLEYNYLPVTKISLSHPITITVVFNVDTDFQPYKIVANLSDLVQNPYYKQTYQQIVIAGNSCHFNNETLNYKCGLSNVIVNPESANVNLNFEVFYTAYNSSSYNLTHTFDIDNDSPALINIRTDYCHEDKCYFKSGPNKIYFEFDDSSENFVRRKVFYSMENNRYPVNYCLNGECYSAMTKICTSGQYYLIDLVTSGNYKSEDDAGNPVVSDDLTRKIYCDSITPFNNALGDNNPYELSTGEEVEGSNIEFIGDVNTYSLISGGNPLMIKAYVFEDGPVVYAQANLSSIGGSNEEVACVKQESIPNLHICEFNVAALLNEHLQQTINFKFTDIVNNSFTTSKEIIILHNPGADVATPDCVDVKAEDFYPKRINRIALDLSQTNSLSYPTYAPYTPERKKGSFCKDAEISEQKIIDCWITTSNGSLMPALGNYFDDSSNINHPYWKLDENNFIDLPISVDPNAIDSTTLICNLSFNLYDNRNIYSDPIIKTIEWDVTLLNSKLGRPGESYVEKLKDTTGNLKDTGYNLLGILNDGLATASKLCKAGNFLKDTLNNMQVAMDVVDFGVGLLYSEYRNNPATSNSIKPAQAMMNGKDYKAVKSGATAALSNVFEMSCWASSCSLANYMKSTSIEDGNVLQDASKTYNDLNTGLLNQYQGDSGEIKDFDSIKTKLGKDLLGNIGTPDLYNSVIACAANGCIPGVVYHINQWRESECDYLYCLKRQAQHGLSIDACEVSKRTFTCKKIVGEVFELPYIREAKNLADNFNHLAQNFVPKILFDVIASGTCTKNYRDVIENPKVKVGDLNIFSIVKCELPLSIGRAIRNKKMTNKLGSFQYPTPEVDICKLALCNEEDQTKCDVESGMTWFNKLMPDQIKSVINSQDMSSFEHMRMLQSNNRHMMENKYYINSLSHYTNLLESCIENNGCDGAKEEALRVATEAYNDYKTKLENEKEDNNQKYTSDEIDKILGETPKLSNYDFANDLEKAASRLHYTYNNNFPSSYEEAMKKVDDFRKNNPGLSGLSNEEILRRSMKEQIIFKELGSDYSEIPGGLGDIEFTEPTIDLTNREIAATETLDDLLGGTLDDEKRLDYESMFADLTQDLKKDLEDNKNYKNTLSGVFDKADAYDKAEEEAERDYDYLARNPPEYAKDLFEGKFGSTWKSEWKRFVETGNDYDAVIYEIKNINTDKIFSVTEEEYLKKYSDKPKYKLINEKDIDRKFDREDLKDELARETEKKKRDIKEYKKKLKSYQTERQKKLDFMQQRNRIRKWTDIAVKWLWNNVVKDVGTLSSMGDYLEKKYDADWLSKFSQNLDNYINSEAWKNSLCNPQTGGLVDFDVDPGSAIDCTGATCRTVLTMAMERTAYNWSDEYKTEIDQYLYTFVYHMGPIKNTNEYNIYFVDDKGEKNCVYRDSNDNCENKQLNMGDINTRSIAFISERYYKEVRFEFKENFPAPAVKVTTVFKRAITESQFDTGQPDRDFEIADLDSPDEGGGVNEVYN